MIEYWKNNIYKLTIWGFIGIIIMMTISMCEKDIEIKTLREEVYTWSIYDDHCFNPEKVSWVTGPEYNIYYEKWFIEVLYEGQWIRFEREKKSDIYIDYQHFINIIKLNEKRELHKNIY